MIEKYEGLSKSTKDEILGVCLFCQTIISHTEVKNNIMNFQFAPQTLFIKFGEKMLRKEVNGFFCCNGCLSHPIRVSLFKQLNMIQINLEELNEEVSKVIQKESIAKKYQEELTKKLEEVNGKEKTKETKKS